MGSQAIGLVGLGVMGRNLALNLAEKGFAVTAWDGWVAARDEFAGEVSAGASGTLSVVASPQTLAAALPAPRTVLVLVKAGDPVDTAIAALLHHLGEDDIVIDGGNSHFRDTIRRAIELQARGIHFIGLGVSGGGEGARHGPALMAGGAAEPYGRIRPMLEAIAARHAGEPCAALLGDGGAGHFVKMVHNGIEYAVMQILAEAYVLMRDVLGLDHGAMAAAFAAWNETELSSYLVGITANILGRQDDLGEGPLVEAILDTAGQKGTGRWSTETALRCGVPATTLAEAVLARSLAARRTERLAAADLLAGPRGGVAVVSRADGLEALRQAVLASVVVAYAQGLGLISDGGREEGWAIDMATVARVWRAGCILRAGLLDAAVAAFAAEPDRVSLLTAPAFAELLAGAQDGWRKTVTMAIGAGVPVPGLTSALSYYDGYRSRRLWANMIQAQRDFFGAHGYERRDRAGVFHTAW